MAGDKLQYVVQFMIAKGCVTSEQFQACLEKLLDKSPLTDENLYQVCQQVNKKINPYHLMVRTVMDEVTTEKYYVLISTVDNEVTRFASHHNPKQLDFFKLILQAIVNDPRGIVSEGDVKDLVTAPTDMSLIDEWERKKWLLTFRSADVSYITLGVRAFAELDIFMEDLNQGSASGETTARRVAIASANARRAAIAPAVTRRASLTPAKNRRVTKIERH